MCSDLGLLRSTKYYTYGRNTLMWSTLVFQTTHSKQWRYSGGTVYVQCGYYCYGSVKTGSHGCGNHSSQTRLLFGSESVMSFLLGPWNVLYCLILSVMSFLLGSSGTHCFGINLHSLFTEKTFQGGSAKKWFVFTDTDAENTPPTESVDFRLVCLRAAFNRAERQWPLRFLSQHWIEQRPLTQWKDILSLACWRPNTAHSIKQKYLGLNLQSIFAKHRTFNQAKVSCWTVA